MGSPVTRLLQSQRLVFRSLPLVLKLHRDRCEICENGDKSLRNRHENYRYNVLKTTRAIGMHLTATESF